MAFVFSAILALLAVGIQSFIAEPINIHTAAAVNAAAANAASAQVAAATQAAAATKAAALSSRLSPWLPSSSWYTPALLKVPPFYMPCDCHLACLIDPRIQAEIERLSVLYGHRMCNIQQWERIIREQMPNLDYQNTVNMLTQMAAAMRREQIRRGLAYAPEYADFCLDYSIYSSAAVTPAVTPAVLVKRDPQFTAADAIAAQNAAAANSALTNADVTNPNFMPLYYNLQFMFEQFLPYISPELQRDIQNAVYNNTPYEYFGQAFTTAQRLKSNARAMVADMIDLTPGSIKDAVSTLIY